MDFSQYVEGNALVLSDTTIDISKLVGFLRSKIHITKLSLKGCGIGYEDVKALANGNLTNLISLDLSDNELDDEGVKALIKALRNGKFPKLTSVTSNGISSPLRKDLDVLLRLNAESKALGEKDGTVATLTQEKSQLEGVLKETKAQFAEKEQGLNEALENAKAQLVEKEQGLNEALENAKAQLVEKEQELNDAQQALDAKITEVTTLTQENTQLQDNLKTTTEEKAKLQGELESTVTTLTKENTELKNELKLKKPKNENNDLKTKLQESESKSKGLESRIENLQKQLESKSKELNGKNEKFLGASTHIKRQGNYASVSNAPFLIAGALASLILLTSGVFTVAPYVAFLAPIAALGVALPVTLTLFVLSAVVIALSYKIISQNKRFDVKEIELNEKNRLAKEQENTIKNLETKIKELDEAKQKLGDEKNKLTQNIKELESEKVKSALENKNKIEKLETKIKEQGSTHQVLVAQCLEKDLELTDIKKELENLKNEQAQKDDRYYHSVHNTPTTFSDSLSPESTLNGAVEHLGPYKENQKRQTEATREGQNQKRRLVSPDFGISVMSLEDDSSLEDTASLMSSVEDFETAARGRSSSLSSTGGSNNDQPGPSSKLSETPLISRSQSLSSLNSSNSDLK